MNKLPVFRVAGRAIGFTLWNCFTIFRLAWLPVALLLAAQIGLSAYIMRLDGETMRGVPNPMTTAVIIEKALVFDIAMLVLEAIAIAAVAVSIHRVILFGERRPGQYLNFGFGKTELLYIVMGFLTALLMLVVFTAAMSPLVIIASGGDPVGTFKKIVDNPELLGQLVATNLRGSGFSIFMAVYFAAAIVILYLSLRLCVWPPAVVATNRLSPSEPWQLTRGNVWRLIGAFLLTFGWIYVLVLIPLAAGSYWYYTNKMKEAQPEIPAITAPAIPDAPSNPATPQAPSSAAPPAPTTEAPQPPLPAAPAPTTPPPAMPAPEAPAAEDVLADDKRAAPRDPEERLREFEAAIGPFAAVAWLVFLFMYIYFTALAVALMSFSYKALKGYEPHEPIPEA